MSALPLSIPLAIDATLLTGRYRVVEMLSRRGGVERLLARDESIGAGAFVQLVRELQPRDEPALPGDGSIWPSLAWEERLRTRCRHHGLPRVLGRFVDGDYCYLVLDVPFGVNLWDAWDDPVHSAADKYGWLIQLADMLQVLHAAGAIVEGLRPDQVVLTDSGQVLLTDSGALLPLPLPADTPIVSSFATPPELNSAEWVDARADLYCFGALVYALILGRELGEMDFDDSGIPKPFLERFPDAHPLLGRLISKTFCPEVHRRFPTSDGFAADPTGFTELIGLLEQCQRTMGRVRLDLAVWSTTGMLRPGNEDAYGIIKTSVGRQDEIEDYAFVVVADGMGGNEAGEVAAALTVQSLYQTMCQVAPFAHIACAPDLCPGSVVETVKAKMIEGIKEANRTVYLASRQGIGRRGMGCTVEAVFTDGRRVVIGHVGDSRAYRFHRGELVQLTRDQTYVNRLVEIGEITAGEAERHPRRAELQQAIGGWSNVEPECSEWPLDPGDWFLVCSDGLSNVLRPEIMRSVFESAPSAEWASRRLVNLANLAGAPDNVTAVVIHAA